MEHADDIITRLTNLELERFSTNDYRGLGNALAFCIEARELPVVISAPHAVSQLREGSVKPSDDFTGAIAIVAAEMAGCCSMVASRFDACDPNWDAFEKCRYKQALAKLVRERGIVAVIDVHGVPTASPFAIEVGSADGETVHAMPGTDELACALFSEELAPFLERQDKSIALNHVHAARGPHTVSNAIARECGVAALQLEISTPFRVPRAIGGHTPKGERVPFTPDQLPRELASRRNPDPACVEATVRAITHLAEKLAATALM